MRSEYKADNTNPKAAITVRVMLAEKAPSRIRNSAIKFANTGSPNEAIVNNRNTPPIAGMLVHSPPICLMSLVCRRSFIIPAITNKAPVLIP